MKAKNILSVAKWECYPGAFGPSYRLENAGKLFASVFTGADGRFCAFMEKVTEDTKWFRSLECAKEYCEITLSSLITP